MSGKLGAHHEELALQAEDEGAQRVVSRQLGAGKAQGRDRLVRGAVRIGAQVRLGDALPAIQQACGSAVALAGVDPHRPMVAARGVQHRSA
jgi:hypothetical protein